MALLTLSDSLFGDNLAFRDAFDSFDHITRSVQDLTRYADRIAQALAQPDNQSLDTRPAAAEEVSRKRKATPMPSADGLRQALRPRITWTNTSDRFVLTATTPGLRKDELNVEVLDVSGQAYLEVSGQTAARRSSTAADEANSGSDKAAACGSDKADKGSLQELPATYRAFKERVLLPEGVDREAMLARYEDGLLVVTMPRAKAESVRRQSIAIS